MLKFTSEMKQIDEWESDILTANNIKSDTSAFQPQDMYGKIIEAWETKARPFKVGTSKQAPSPAFRSNSKSSSAYPPDTNKKASAPAFRTTAKSVNSTKAPRQLSDISIVKKENTGSISSSEKVDVSATETQSHTVDEQEEKESLEENDEEIAQFLQLWDKYKHSLEEILVQRHLKQLQAQWEGFIDS